MTSRVCLRRALTQCWAPAEAAERRSCGSSCAGSRRPQGTQAPPDWQEILTCFRGSELQNYFTKVLEHDLKAIIKPQYVDQIPKTVKGSVGSILARKDETKTKDIAAVTIRFLITSDRDQHLPGRLRAHGEPALPGDLAGVQGG
ncbi:ATP-binding cassette sub-family E member 1 [Arapaima gigas]